MPRPSQAQEGLGAGIAGLARGFSAGIDASDTRKKERMMQEALEARHKSDKEMELARNFVPPAMRGKLWFELTGKEAPPEILDPTRETPLGMFEMLARSKAAGGVAGKPLKPRVLTPSQIGEVQDRMEAAANLRRLRQQVGTEKGVMGPVKGRFLGLKSMVGSQDPEVLRYQNIQSLYGDVRQAIGKAKEGGVLREADEKKYLKILGDPNVTPEATESILAELEQRYEEDRQRRLGQLKQFRYEIPEDVEGWRVEHDVPGEVPPPEFPPAPPAGGGAVPTTAPGVTAPPALTPEKIRVLRAVPPTDPRYQAVQELLRASGQ